MKEIRDWLLEECSRVARAETEVVLKKGRETAVIGSGEMLVTLMEGWH